MIPEATTLEQCLVIDHRCPALGDGNGCRINADTCCLIYVCACSKGERHCCRERVTCANVVSMLYWMCGQMRGCAMLIDEEYTICGHCNSSMLGIDHCKQLSYNTFNFEMAVILLEEQIIFTENI